MENKNLFKGYLFVILSAVIYGLMPLMTKFIYKEGVNPVTLVFLRNLLSVPMLAIMVFKSKNSVKTDLKTFAQIGVVGLMGCCLTPLLLFLSYNYIQSGTATVIHSIYPAVVLVGEFVFLKSKLRAGQILSVIICITGIAMFYNPNDELNPTGSLYALLSGFAYAAYVIALPSLKKKNISVFNLSLYIAIICSLVMLCVCIFSGQFALPTSVKGWMLVIFFAFVLNVVAVVLFQKGTFVVGGSRASILSTFDPITSVVAGVIVFNEGLSVFTVVGTALVIGASILTAVSDMRAIKVSE